ncbi:peptide chain release factor N(5)-glutamine methyltransferase [Patescibacteria group bacterium]|nr:MAG: peptide chain release factor N(5)-glutamine methyltransferase [Patescibacteria group bacterium]
MTIQDLFKKYPARIDSLDLELILACVLKKSREFVLAHPEHKIPATRNSQLINLIGRRTKGEPLAYLLGHKEFYGLDFLVNQHTLVPRPETELLVEKALEELHNQSRNKLRNIHVIDLGTGSGNIIISLAHNIDRGAYSKLSFSGIDISADALRVAKKNAKRLGLDGEIKFLKGNLLDPIIKERYALRTKRSMLITANLPYLDQDWKNLLKSSDTRGLKYEPSIALYAGKDGLDAYRELAGQLKQLKNVDITLLCEIGHLQRTGMQKIFSFAKEINFFKDLASKWRVCKVHLFA